MKLISTTKKKKLTLETAQDFSALGISSVEKDYRLCFKINKSLDIDFQKDAKLIIHDFLTKQKQEVECYIYKDAEMPCTFYLVKNRQEAFFIIPIYRQADYILLFQPPPNTKIVDDFKKRLSTLPIIQSTFAISNDQLKHIDAE
ncbi:MAG: IPExxxVDY family protein [Flavobacterium sp.]|nr:MAG: IPExxxVDY family protein [Flavobacterium sp.]